MQKMRDNIPILCIDCEHHSLTNKMRDIVCGIKGKKIGCASKPKWCPLPPLYYDEDEERQMTIFDKEKDDG